MESLGKLDKNKIQAIAAEILLILTVFCFFMTAACIDKRRDAVHYLGIFILTGISDLLIAAGWICLIISFRDKVVYFYRERRILWEKTRGLLGALLFCFFSRVVQLTDTPKWDSLVYYRELMAGCKNFDFTLGSFLDGFALANHPTQGFAIFAAIGEFLNYGGYVGALITQLVLNLLMTFCLYKVISKLIPSCSWIYHCIATCTVLSTPLTLGTFSYFQPDAGTVYFFVFVLYCVLYKRNILFVFCSILLALTKEIGIVILGGFGIGLLLGKILFGREGRNAGERFRNFMRSPIGRIGVIACFCFLAYLIYFVASGKTIWTIENDNISGFSTISFQPEYILFRWKQFFILNFSWLIWAGILLAGFYILIKSWKKKGFSVLCTSPELVVSLFVTETALILFYCSYVTYGLPRYHVLAHFVLVLILIILLPICVCKEKIVQLATALLGTILLIQAYITIDPVSMLAFETSDTGNGKIISERLGREVTAQADFCVYNHQFNYLDKAYTHVLRDVNYHEGMDIVVWDTVGDYGLWERGVYWDLDEEKLAWYPDENHVVLRGTERVHLDSGAFVPSAEAVFILTPQFRIVEDVAEEYLKQYYEIRYKGYVDLLLGGRVTFYVCDLISAGGNIE